MKIHEGGGGSVELSVEEGRLVLREGSTVTELSPLGPALLERVFARYGLPLDPARPLGGGHPVARLEVGHARIVHVRHKEIGDVIAKDYLVLERASGEPAASCALATHIAAALQHLAARIRGDA